MTVFEETHAEGKEVAPRVVGLVSGWSGERRLIRLSSQEKQYGFMDGGTGSKLDSNTSRSLRNLKIHINGGVIKRPLGRTRSEHVMVSMTGNTILTNGYVLKKSQNKYPMYFVRYPLDSSLKPFRFR